MSEPMPTDLWTYRAVALFVVDGDTLDAKLDTGLRSYRVERLRLLGIDTPELNRAASRPAAILAADYVRAWLAHDVVSEWPLIVRTVKADAFGRYLATCWRVTDSACLNSDLVSAGHAVVWVKSR